MDESRKTAVYIDGYNLYCCLRGTAFKWLDIVALFDQVLSKQDPQASLHRVNYFTAPALGRFATHGGASVQAQQDYHRALLALHPERLVMTFGSHHVDRGGSSLPSTQLPVRVSVKRKAIRKPAHW